MELILTIRTPVTDETNAREKFRDLKNILDQVMELKYSATVTGTVMEGPPIETH